MMRRKVYLHFEPQETSLESFTGAYTLDAGDGISLKRAFEDFGDKVLSRLPQLKGSKFDLANAELKTIDFDKAKNELIESEDLFLIVASQKVAAPSSSSTAPTNPPTSEDIKAIEKLMKNKLYRTARIQIQKWLPFLKPRAESKEEAYLLWAMMTIDMYGERYDQVVARGTYASKKYRQVGIEIFYLLAKAYFNREDFDEAVQCMDTVLTLWASVPAQKFLPAKLRTDDYFLELTAFYAECLFYAGQPREAADKVNEVMTPIPKAGEHLGILTAYSRFALQYNKIEDAFNAVLKIIATIGTKPIKEQPEKARVLISDFFAAPGAISLFLSKVPCNKVGAAEIYAYLGSTVKDFSKFDEALRLYEIAMGGDAFNASYALNRAHVYEMKGDLQAALREIMAFCDHNAQLGLNMQSKDGSAFLSCGDVRGILRDENAAREFAQHCVITWVEGDNAFASVLVDGVEEALVSSELVEYSGKDLDLLALFSLVSKLVYLLDMRVYLPLLIHRIEPVRRLSKKKLHETTVRNELAYYQDIAQIVSVYYRGESQGGSLSVDGFGWGRVLSNLPSPNIKPLYVVGDSHCLSAAWGEVIIKGESRRLIPRLVTGLKHWHLREKSKFHPKTTFFNVLSGIPDQAEILFVVGEIDCREGMLKAVERDVYASVEQGAEATVSIFVKVLQQLMKRKRFTVWIHPVAPVLNETRPIVLAYNVVYRQAINKMKGELDNIIIMLQKFHFNPFFFFLYRL
ncbi:hypothetical protein EON65_20300 [archaeon]|nr:MAG: hypothetical protein EON65_20300 [archaeon]